MCMSTPSVPKPEPMPEPPPAPPPAQEMPVATPAPEMVNAGEDTTKVKKPRSKRSLQQQQAQGTSALKIPLNSGGTPSAKKSGSGLNIPS